MNPATHTFARWIDGAQLGGHVREHDPKRTVMQHSPAWRSLNRKIIACDRCPRLREYCGKVGQEKRRAYANWDYWAQPVPNFGSAPAPLLIVGLAPAAHGANR